MRVTFTPMEQVDCSVEEVMHLSADRLCTMAWPFLSPDDLSCSMTDLFVPPPVPINLSDSATENTFFSGIQRCAQRLTQQLEAGGFCDSLPISCYHLRRALIGVLLQRMGESTPKGSHAGAARGNKLNAGPCFSAVCPNPISSTLEPHGVSSRQTLPTACVGETPAETPADEDTSPFGPQQPVKNPLWPYAQGTRDDAWLAVEVARMVRDAQCGTCDKGSSTLVSTAAELGVWARVSGRAGSTFVFLLRALLKETDELTAMPPAEDEMCRLCEAGPCTSASHRCDFLFRVVLPVLHMVPLLPWRARELFGIGEALALVSNAQVGINGGFVAQDESPVKSVAFVARSGLTVTSCNADLSSPTLPPASSEHPLSARHFKPAVDRCTSESISDPTPDSSHEQSTTTTATSSSPFEESGTSPSTGNSARSGGIHWHVSPRDASAEDFSDTTLQTANDAEGDSEDDNDDDDEWTSSGSVSSSGEWNSALQHAGNDQHSRRTLASTEVAASVSSQDISTTAPFMDTPPLSAKVHRTSHAACVNVAVSKAVNCSDIRLMLIPAETCAASVDRADNLLPQCHEPREGEVYELSGNALIIPLSIDSTRSHDDLSLVAEVTSDVHISIDTCMSREWVTCVATAQRTVATRLLHAVQRSLPEMHAIPSLPAALFRGGLIETDGAEVKSSDGNVAPPLHAFVESLAIMPDDNIRALVHCRLTDVPGVRAALRIAAYFLTWRRCTNCNGVDLHWQSRVWLDVVRRVRNGSASLGSSLHAGSVAQFILTRVQGCVARPEDVVEATLSMLTSPSLTAEQLCTVLTARRTNGERASLLLRLLKASMEHSGPHHYALVASTFKEFLMLRGHYISSFLGSGTGLEKAIRHGAHDLLGTLFSTLPRVSSACATGAHATPQKYLLEPSQYGAFSLVTLSLLASELDTEDMGYASREALPHLISLFPDPLFITRMDSLSTSEEEVRSLRRMLTDLQHPTRLNRAAIRRSEVPLLGTKESSPCVTASDDAAGVVYSVDPIVLCDERTGGTARQVSIQLLEGPIDHFYVGLATCPYAKETFNMMTDDQGIYILSDGTLRCGGMKSQIIMPPWRVGDVLGLLPNFDTARWRLDVLLNGCCVASVVLPPMSLYLILAHTDPSQARTRYRGSVRCLPTRYAQRGMLRKQLARAGLAISPNALCDPDTKSVDLIGLCPPGHTQDIVANNERARRTFKVTPDDSLPTDHYVSHYAALVLHYLAMMCARRVHSQSTRDVAGHPAVSGSSSTTHAMIATPLTRETEDVIVAFLDRSCEPLSRVVERVVLSLRTLQPLSESDDSTKHVKHQAALAICNHLLKVACATLSTIIRSVSSPVKVLQTLTEVVRCPQAEEQIRCIALSAVHRAMVSLPGGAGGFGLFAFDPTQLWAACTELAKDTAADGYRPHFSRISVPEGIAVLAGGRRVQYSRVGSSRVAHRTTNYACEGIPLDGSAGESVSFAVRVQRAGRNDSLGRYYFVGFACCRSYSTVRTLTAYPGDQSRQHSIYCVADFLLNMPSQASSKELARYRHNWLSAEESIIFGSGDVLTVTVDVLRRGITFERNGKSLGMLYQALPASVNVLFPFVELRNTDSLAKWMLAPREVALHARSTMRAMLQLWPLLTGPLLSSMLLSSPVSACETRSDADIAAAVDAVEVCPEPSPNEVALMVLGADGDERCMAFRAPPRFDFSSPTQDVRLVRIDASWAVVVDASGMSFRVLASALEPVYPSSIRPPLPVLRFAHELLNIVDCLLPARPNVDTHSMIIKRPASCLRALRLLAESAHLVSISDDPATGEQVQRLLRRLLDVLLVESMDIPPDVQIREAWSKLVWSDLKEVHLSLSVPITPSPSGSGEVAFAGTGVFPDASSRESRTGGNPTVSKSGGPLPLVSLKCPVCDEEWGCCSADHPAPASECALFDMLLRHLGQSSPYVGWCTTWTDDMASLTNVTDTSNPAADADTVAGSDAARHDSPPEEHAEGLLGSTEASTRGSHPINGVEHFCSSNIRVELHRHPDDPNILEGTGETLNGRFQLYGHLQSDTVLQARIVFDHATVGTTPEESALPDEEWPCTLCTFLNPSSMTRCVMCLTPRPGSVWTCSACSYAFNPNTVNLCTMCGRANQGGRRRPGSLGDERSTTRLCYCEECESSVTYSDFSELRLHRHCTTCDRMTAWLPTRVYAGLMEARLVGTGDELQMSWVIERRTYVAYGLHTASYSSSGMRARLEACWAESVAKGVDSTLDLTRYVPPLYQSSLAVKVREPSSVPSSTFGSCLPSVAAYYASWLVLMWCPALSPELLQSVDVLARLRVCDERWLQQVQERLSLHDAALTVRVCLRLLTAGTVSAHAIQTASSIARVLIHAHPELHGQRHYLLYALCLCSSAQREKGAREECYAGLNAILESWATDPLRAQPLRHALHALPVVAGQQRALVHARRRGVAVTGGPFVCSAACLVDCVVSMDRREPLPKVLEGDVSAQFAYAVHLADTRLTEGGSLLMGQIRGSVGKSPTKGGLYYYEVVLPMSAAASGEMPVVVGWGTLEHGHASSGKHVGSDLHSWGFHCKGSVIVMMEEQMTTLPQRPTAGDTIGTLLNLEAMMVCWTLNGQEIMWVAVPVHGDGEEIYPYVSASIGGDGVTVRFIDTLFKPEGYVDYGAATALTEGASSRSDVQPQSYDFYRQLSNLLDDVAVPDTRLLASVSTALTAPGMAYLFSRYPLVHAVVFPPCVSAEWATSNADRGAASDTPSAPNMAALMPYVVHLQGIGDLVTAASRGLTFLRDSPYFSQCYQRALGLLSSSARWAVFDAQVSDLPVAGVLQPRKVTIDLQRCEKALESPSEEVRLNQSLTGSLYAQIGHAHIYRQAVMFSVSLVDDVTSDAGGVTRSILSMMSEQLNYHVHAGARCDPLVPLFKLCPHSTMFTVVPNMRLLQDAASPAKARHHRRMFYWLGLMLGHITLYGTMKLALLLPRLAWKYLTFEDATIDDYYYDVDDSVRNSINDDGFLLDDDCYGALVGTLTGLRDGDECPPMGSIGTSMARVMQSCISLFSVDDVLCEEEEGCFGLSSRQRYTADPATVAERRQCVTRMLLHQYDDALSAMRQGLTNVIPPNSLRSIRWDDLQTRVCGTASIRTEHVMSFMDCTRISNELREMLLEVIVGMSERQRSDFLLFCSGQSRLPLPERIHVTCGDDTALVPTAHTCTPISLRLQPYRSADELREKLDICLSHAQQFGFV